MCIRDRSYPAQAHYHLRYAILFYLLQVFSFVLVFRFKDVLLIIDWIGGAWGKQKIRFIRKISKSERKIALLTNHASDPLGMGARRDCRGHRALFMLLFSGHIEKTESSISKKIFLITHVFGPSALGFNPE